MRDKIKKASRQFLIVESIFVGIFAGAVGVAFRVSLSYSELMRTKFLLWAQHASLKGFFLWMLVIILSGLIAGMAAKFVPNASGSGIPQVKAILSNMLKVNWWKIILAKFVGGLFALGSGFSLGREGPTVQLGAAVAQGISRLTGRPKSEEKYLITSGAAAGLAAAFNAPLAAVIFALEELQHNFSPYVISSALIASVFADLVAQKVTGKGPVINAGILTVIPIQYFLLLIGIGVLAGIIGIIFNKLIEKSSEFTESHKISKMSWVLVVAFLVAIIGYIYPITLGGGNDLIIDIMNGKILLLAIPMILLLKFILTIACYATGVPGGIFLPMLVIGALLGSFYGQGLAYFFPLLQQYAHTYAVIGMAAIFSAIVRAPVTGTVLIIEMTGSFHHLFALLTASMTAFLIAEHFEVKPVYEMLMKRLIRKNYPRRQKVDIADKILIDITVETGSLMELKQVKNIKLPSTILLVTIKRGNDEIIPKGNTTLYAGDIITILIPEEDKVAIISDLDKLLKSKSMS